MNQFDKLMRNKTVANHPLLSGYQNLGSVRENIQKHAQDLNDMFTMGETQEDSPRNLNELIRDAAVIVQDTFAQFHVPVNPKFFYEASRDIKHARNDETRVVEGSIVFGAEFRSTLGVRKRATIAVPISAGQLVTPSVMEVDGSLHVISQSGLDDILERNDSTYLPPLRESYQDPPLTRAEREIATEMRNAEGYKKRENPGEYYMNQKQVEASSGSENMTDEQLDYVEKLMEEGRLQEFLDEVGADAEFDADTFEIGYDGWPLDERDFNIFRERFEGKIASEKTAAGEYVGGTPRMWKQVTEAMDKAEEDGLDTFPRPYVYLMRNYILDFVSTASKDEWEPHLINAGYAISVYGPFNRGRSIKSQVENIQDLADILYEDDIEISDEKLYEYLKRLNIEKDSVLGGLIVNQSIISKEAADLLVRLGYAEITDYYGEDLIEITSSGVNQLSALDDGVVNEYWDSYKESSKRRAQNVKADFEKDVEMEVEEPDQIVGVDELLDEVEEKPEKKPGKGPRFYQDTKTPIENGDGVKCRKGPGGKGFQGTIVEIDEEGDYLILKSKGMEYRVTVEDIEPMPSTFKKMYL